MSKPVLALNKNGQLTPCRALPENRGKRRCTHVQHYNYGSFAEVKDWSYGQGKEIKDLTLGETELPKTIDGKLRKLLELPHNMRAYTETKYMLKHEDRVCIVQATGTGKSCLIQGFLENAKKAIIVYPNQNVRDQFLAYGRNVDKTHTILHQSLINVYDRGSFYSEFGDKNAIDYIFIDEAHRAGAKQWVEAINALIAWANPVKVVGLTATNVRESGLDVVDQIFEGNSTSNLTLEKAFSEGVLPIPKYVTGYLNKDEYVQRVFGDKYSKLKNLLDGQKQQFDKELQASLDKMSDESGFASITAGPIKKKLEEYDNKNQSYKMAVFCQNRKEQKAKEEEIMSQLRAQFPGYEISSHVINSGVGSKLNDKNLASFNEEKGKKHIQVLFSIDMFNEGTHINNLSTCILCRHTKSDIVYKQQIGRVLGLSSDREPLIVDLSSNYMEESKEKTNNDEKGRTGLRLDTWKAASEDCLDDRLEQVNKELKVILDTAIQTNKDMSGFRR